jgi:DNA (cytosine-5)-methyltransferase 1
MKDYPAHLDAMWQKHLAAREPNAPTVVSTFAGAGGSSLGYSMAGFRELLAVEWDDNAVETFRLNFPGVPVYHGDIAKLSVDECLSMAGIAPGELDVLDGSPPCQGFSTAGKRQIDDPRNQLFREYVRLLRGLRPKVFVMENVSGMVKGKMKLVFVDILKELKASGYRVSARLLNAMYFHVPQSRERMIFIGVRDDLGIEPTHPRAEGRPVTVGEAWQTVKQELAPYLSPKLASIIPFIPTWGDGGDVVNSFFSTKRLSFAYPSRTLLKGNTGSR